VGVVVLSNQEEGAFASSVAAGVLQLMLQAKLGRVPPDAVNAPGTDSATNVPVEHLRRLEGEYKSSGPLVTFVAEGGRLHLVARTEDTALAARGPSEFVTGQRTFRFVKDSAGLVTGVEVLDPHYTTNGAEFWPLNRSPRDPPGPDEAASSAYVGRYENTSYGSRVEVQISLRDGYLFTSWHGGLRLTQFGAGLFYTPEGEVLDFQSPGELRVGNRRFARAG
jgi:hypothetical protein